MSEATNNEPAFPRNYDADGHNGMTLRDYFAAKALQGLLCNPEMRRDWGPQEWAEESYRYADAMLGAREDKA